MANLIINKLYSFNTIAPSILGASFTNVRLVAIMDYNLANKQKNVELLQRQVAPFLLPGTPTDIKNHQFYKFQITPLEFVVVSDYWVTTAGFTPSSSVDAIVTVFNTNGVDDINIISQQLRLLGYTFSVSTVSSNS